VKPNILTLGQRVLGAMQQVILDNVFIIIALIVVSLLIMDYYNRFLRIVKNTDNVNLIERYCWLQVYKRYKGNR
jgi:hypothetical protein